LEENLMKRRSAAVAAILIALVLFTGAIAVASSRNYNTHLTGDNEVPVRVTNAQGEAKLKLEKDGDLLRYKLNVANIENVWMAHLHLGPAGSNGPIVVWLYPKAPPNPTASIAGRTQGTLAEGEITAANLVGPLAGKSLNDLIANINAGNIYVNVHTNDFVDPANTGPGDFPGGEIRGQLHDH
jgi:hypothetical protein